MKKRISSYTITCSRPNNYGAVLQTYALNKALTKLDVDAKVIDYNPSYYKISNQRFIKKLIRNIIRIPDNIKGNRVFGDFLQQYVPMSAETFDSYADLLSNPPQADLYIAGSDQIWNCMNKENGKDDAFFLTFAPTAKRRITYAASLAMPHIPNSQKARYHNLIEALDQVSVREPSAKPLLQEIGIRNVKTVPDPVFLLNRDDWDELADQSDFKKTEDYILVYGYNRQKDVYSYAKELAKKLNIKVYIIGNAIEDYFLPGDKYFWNASPNTFIDLIRNAKAVVTNSFHGTVFSLIYNVPFHFFTVKQSTNSRMLDLLSTTGLINRHVTDSKLLSNSVSFENANSVIATQRDTGIEYLISNIEAVRNNENR